MAGPAEHLRYAPQSLDADSVRQLAAQVAVELWRVGAVTEAGLARTIEFLNVEPTKPYEGLTVGADGTNWNPGGGQGVYTYYNSTWNKLG